MTQLPQEDDLQRKKVEPSFPAVPPPAGILEKGWRYRHYIFYSLLVVALIGIVIWHNVTVSNLKAEAQAKRERLVETAAAQKTEVESTLLKTMGFSIAWGVRTALLKGSVAEIGEFTSRFVTQKGVRLVAVAKEDGTILVSTDQKLEKQPLTQFFPPQALEGDEPTVIPLQDGNLVVAAPVMGFAARIGTVAVLYIPEKGGLE